MIAFTRRNLLVFFRDRAAVFFSLLASLIIIGLYVLFLGDVYVSSFDGLEHASEVMNNWVMASLLATTSVTTTMGAFSIMVNDRTQKISKDFFVSPISRKKIAGGYVLSALLIGFVMSIITLVVAQVYIVAKGGTMLGFISILKVVAFIMLADLANCAMMFLVTTFFFSAHAFSTASSVIGTLVGFVTGIYLPIGMLPDSVQWIIKLCPTSHAAALLRQVMMEESMRACFLGVPEQYMIDCKHTLGVTYQFGNLEINQTLSIIFLIVSTILCFLLALVNLRKKKS